MTGTATSLPTRREFLAKKGLAQSLEQQRKAGKRPGGRLSAAAHKALVEAEASGQRFAD